MFQKLDGVVARFEALEAQLVDPAVLADHHRYTALAREHAELAQIVHAFRELTRVQSELEDARLMLDEADPEIRALAKDELHTLDAEQTRLQDELRVLLLPKDPLDDKNIILEIRAGTGGDEAALFSGDLFEAYQRFAGLKKWHFEVLNASPGTMGGFKEVVALIQGDRVYSHLKYEAGTHRVQRVPATESQGRIHTSACTVAILPEAEDVDVAIDPKDLKIDTYRASGAGGQHVNKTDSAVRITHIPTGLVVAMQDERSQHKNRDRALKVLRSRLLDLQQTQQHQARAEERRAMVGSGDRSERIRTYNYPQNRISDHRINLTLYSLDRVMATGDFDELIASLRAHEQALLLSESEHTAP